MRVSSPPPALHPRGLHSHCLHSRCWASAAQISGSWLLILLRCCVFLHPAGLLPIVKEIVEMLFCRGVIKARSGWESQAAHCPCAWAPPQPPPSALALLRLGPPAAPPRASALRRPSSRHFPVLPPPTQSKPNPNPHAQVLFSTETFAMGVNAPARTVVFQSLRCGGPLFPLCLSPWPTRPVHVCFAEPRLRPACMPRTKHLLSCAP